MSQYGVISEFDVCRLEIVAELDTGSWKLGLPPEHIEKLQLQIFGSPIAIESVLSGKKTKVVVFGPVTIEFCVKSISVPTHELKHTP